MAKRSATGSGMMWVLQGRRFNRGLTDFAKKAIEAGQLCAWQRGLKSWSPTHLLVGIAALEKSAASDFLRAKNLGDAALVVALSRRQPARKRAGAGFATRSGRGVSRLAQSLYQSVRGSDSRFIGTEDLLLAILETPDRGVDRVLSDLGANRSELGAKFRELWKGGAVRSRTQRRKRKAR